MQIDSRSIDDIKVIEINEYTLAFYAGRDWTRIREEPNWIDDGAMKLGIATYAIYKNNKAVIYDTFADIRQAMWVRNHLEQRGIKVARRTVAKYRESLLIPPSNERRLRA